VRSRGEVLSAFANAERTVAVCGSHGKTTTACFTATLLRAMRKGSKASRPAGRAAPGWCIGGYTDALGCVASTPGAGAPFVIEADESDGTLALYHPDVTVITSVEQDHLEHFASFDALVACFRAVARQTHGVLVYCADSPVAAGVAAGGAPGAAGGALQPISYGFSDGALLRAADVVCGASSSTFTLEFSGRRVEGLRLSVPGRHNVLNALGAIGAALALGHGVDEVLASLGALCELPHRRFESIRCRAGFNVISDYSHHPTEIRALLETARGLGKPILAIFQPHRHTRTKALAGEFADAFEALGAGDRLILLPVYAAFERPLEGGTTADLYARLRERNAAGRLSVVPELARSVDEVMDFLRVSKSLLARSTTLVIGAGDVVALAARLRGAVKFRDVAPVSLKVSLGVPAFADEIVSPSAGGWRGELRAIGQGTNLLPSPLGVRGRVMRVSDDTLDFEEGADGKVLVTAGCGIGGSRLLAALARRGLAGLEFMAGIPGTLGGWLAMNAGTRRGEVGDAVVDVTAMRRNGRVESAARSRCGFAYRQCAWLRDKLALKARLRLRRDDPDAVLTRMRLALEARFDFGGLRTAGSAFKNPPGGFAGALLEQAGCKGLRVGGAFVSERHANIVATEPGAMASDVMALLEIMRGRVLRRCGVNLELEIRQW
ncbi:MAG: FAD-binding protein, partial [Kiritimatiellae bacterium]|nr:FAD-binding protein [Kiritimatiellia bacterium]